MHVCTLQVRYDGTLGQYVREIWYIPPILLYFTAANKITKLNHTVTA